MDFCFNIFYENFGCYFWDNTSIFVGRGFKQFASVVGFLEVIFWISALGFVMANLTSILAYISYALGFSLGVYIGMLIEEKLAIGVLLMEVILSENTDKFIESLKVRGYGATIIEGKGLFHPVQIVYVLFERKRLCEILGILNSVSPDAFYSLQDIRSNSQNKRICAIPNFGFDRFRKGK